MRCQPGGWKQVYKWLNNEQSCLLCDQRGDYPRPICSPCEADLPLLEAACRICALPMPADDLICGECQKQRPYFDQVQTPWRYAFPVDALITRFKHHGKWPLGRLLGVLLSHHLQNAFARGLPRPDLLLPVPLGKQRLRQRGFNQAGMLADWLHQHLNLPIRADLLRRDRETDAQQELDAAARQRNLRNAFALSEASLVKGKHLALVDDVLTTGATANSLARLLKKAGATRVDVYCLARTPKPGETA
ncbi:ComF family protein [Pseudomonas turukhanskensis]|uniref:Amidophosphoribosyltransferase n=1 Tax=Pseudomonas turukhanskensis TaxID=1806536 RepID=A0A9W6KCB9_9PSED|nr:ComF family protein [Pseudomonas turukhanskensis]GLK90893.1 amidophosphoribosyltransferase [Pseudomonas turukhanskensis]